MDVKDVTFTFTVDADIPTEDVYSMLGLDLTWPPSLRGVRLEYSGQARPAHVEQTPTVTKDVSIDATDK